MLEPAWDCLRAGFNPCCDGTDSSTPTGGQPGCPTGGVSILVVMERTHRPSPRCTVALRRGAVSILVVMERTHRRSRSLLTGRAHTSFNPCCDGTDSSTRSHTMPHRLQHGVSILVVMERTHRLGAVPFDSHELEVSILVVMERTHRPSSATSRPSWPRCFNPCCDGTDSSTAYPGRCRPPRGEVSILVVMERTHRQARRHQGRAGRDVSILVVMERTHRHHSPSTVNATTTQFQSLL